jgi:hypothetical protein
MKISIIHIRFCFYYGTANGLTGWLARVFMCTSGFSFIWLFPLQQFTVGGKKGKKCENTHSTYTQSEPESGHKIYATYINGLLCWSINGAGGRQRQNKKERRLNMLMMGNERFVCQSGSFPG